MNTAHFSHPRSIRPRPDQDRDGPAQVRDSLLVVSGVLAAAVVLLTLALVSDRLLFHDAVTLEPSPPVAASPVAGDEDAFHQQKLEAKSSDLPAQF